MNIKEALETAIKYETKVRNVYRTAMEKTLDDKTRKLLYEFAKEEHGHLEYLRKAYAHLMKNGKLDRFSSDLEEVWYEAEDSLLLVEENLEHDDHRANSMDVLESILDIEQETHGFYLKVSNELPNKQQQFFERFVLSEKRHLEMIQGRLDKIQKNISYVPSSR